MYLYQYKFLPFRFEVADRLKSMNQYVPHFLILTIFLKTFHFLVFITSLYLLKLCQLSQFLKITNHYLRFLQLMFNQFCKFNKKITMVFILLLWSDMIKHFVSNENQ